MWNITNFSYVCFSTFNLLISNPSSYSLHNHKCYGTALWLLHFLIWKEALFLDVESEVSTSMQRRVTNLFKLVLLFATRRPFVRWLLWWEPLPPSRWQTSPKELQSTALDLAQPELPQPPTRPHHPPTPSHRPTKRRSCHPSPTSLSTVSTTSTPAPHSKLQSHRVTREKFMVSHDQHFKICSNVWKASIEAFGRRINLALIKPVEIGYLKISPFGQTAPCRKKTVCIFF